MESKTDADESARRIPTADAPSRPTSRREQSAANSDLLDQFYLTLRSTQTAVESQLPDGNPVCEQIRELFDAPRSWRGAYEVEQLQCFLLSGAHLETEIRRRLDEAQRHDLPYVSVLRAQVDDAARWKELTDVEKRPLLHRLINDLQWFYTQRFRRRQTAQLISYRVSLLFLASFVLMLAVLLWQGRYLQVNGPEVASVTTTLPDSAVKE